MAQGIQHTGVGISQFSPGPGNVQPNRTGGAGSPVQNWGQTPPGDAMAARQQRNSSALSSGAISPQPPVQANQQLQAEIVALTKLLSDWQGVDNDASTTTGQFAGKLQQIRDDAEARLNYLQTRFSTDANARAWNAEVTKIRDSAAGMLAKIQEARTLQSELQALKSNPQRNPDALEAMHAKAKQLLQSILPPNAAIEDLPSAGLRMLATEIKHISKTSQHELDKLDFRQGHVAARAARHARRMDQFVDQAISEFKAKFSCDGMNMQAFSRLCDKAAAGYEISPADMAGLQLNRVFSPREQAMSETAISRCLNSLVNIKKGSLALQSSKGMETLQILTNLGLGRTEQLFNTANELLTIVCPEAQAVPVPNMRARTKYNALGLFKNALPEAAPTHNRKQLHTKHAKEYIDTAVAALKKELDAHIGNRIALEMLPPDRLDKVICKAMHGIHLSRAAKSALKDALHAAVSERLAGSAVHVGKELGRGAIGIAHEGTINGQACVVKSLQRPDANSKTDMVREALMQGAFDGNAHLPKVYDIQIPADGATLPSLVMEKIEGEDLWKFGMGQLAKQPAETRASVAAHLMRGMVDGLSALHEAGVGHFDIKPSNIMLDKNSLEARLIDFGGAGQQGTTAGFTPEYVPRLRPADLALSNDVYAVGITMLQFITGKVGYDGLDPGNPSYQDYIRYKLLGGQLGDGSKYTTVWDDNPALRPVWDAIGVLVQNDYTARPTMDQLKDAMEGKEPRLSGPNESGLKNREDYLKLVALLCPHDAAFTDPTSNAVTTVTSLFPNGKHDLEHLMARQPQPVAA